MQLIPADSMNATQVKPLIEKSHGLPFRTLVGVFLTYENLNLIC